MTAPVSYQEIPAGDAGTKATLRQMVRIIRAGAWDPVVRRQALRILGLVNGRDGKAQALTLREWLADHFQFVRDPTNVELLHTPARLLTDAGPDGIVRADCDDAAMLGAALAQSVGLQARLVVVGFLSPNAPYRHVWAEVAAPSGPDANTWIELDVTRSAQKIPVDKISRWLVVPVSDTQNTTLTLWVGVALCILIWGSISSRT